MSKHDLTTEPIVSPQTGIAAPTPIYLRLPRPRARCFYTGMSRSALYNLAVPCKANNFRAPVRSVALRQRGAKRAIRLIDFQSLMSFLRAQMQEQVAQ